MKKSLKIFLIFNGTNEILSARIIEDLIANGEKKENIIIFVSENYKLSLLQNYKIVQNNKFQNNPNNHKYLTKLKNLFYFLHRKNKLLSLFYLRLGTFPLGLEKIKNMNSIYKKDFKNLEREHIDIFTPNVRVHNFQYLVFLSNNFNYHLIEEGKLSFKNKHEWGPFSKMERLWDNFIDIITKLG